MDLSSGEDDEAGDVQVLSEIRCNSPGKRSSSSSAKKVVHKSAVSRSSASSSLSNELITSQVRSSATNGRDSGSYLSDEDVQMASQVSEEDMDLDMSEFLDVLVDEKAAADREDDLMLAVAISSEQESEDFRNSSQNDYKLSNFRNMIDFVLNEEAYSHLLNQEDWQILENVTTASVAAQRLFIR